MANQKAQALTDRTIMSFKKPLVKKWVRDGGGLAVCLTPTTKGAWRQWYFIYVSPETGKRCYKPLGSYPELGLNAARKITKGLAADVLKKVDPMADERRQCEAKVRADEEQRLARETEEQRIRISELVQEYIEKHAKIHKKSWQEDERILNKEVVPLWGDRKAADIKKRDVVLLLESIMGRSAPGMSNNTFQVVRKMFNFAVERDILPYSPATGIKALAPKVRRERTLSTDEVKTLWETLEKAAISGDVIRALKLVLVTAQRPVEVTGMHTGEIDGHWWTIPVDRSKNKNGHRVYLTEMALDLIGDMQGKGYIFPSPHKTKTQPIDSHALPVAVMRNLAWPIIDNDGKPVVVDGKASTVNRLEVGQFTPHDLRRTAATFMAEMGFMDEIIDAVLNHVKKGIIRTYNLHSYDKEKQMALEAWELKLKSILSLTGKPEEKVIPMMKKSS